MADRTMGEGTRESKPLTRFRLAHLNVAHSASRTKSLVFLVALLSFALFTGGYLSLSMGRGMSSLADRLGADVLVLPSGTEGEVRGTILKGNPSKFYMPSSILDDVTATPGVAAASPQLFLATLSAGCCNFAIQLIGFDPETDFNIRPWVARQIQGGLESCDIVVGANIVAQEGETLLFFGETFRVAARLERTGMGFDNSAFVTVETARRLMQNERFRLNYPEVNDPTTISSVMVRVDEKSDAAEVAQKLRRRLKDSGVTAMSSVDVVRGVAEKFKSMRVYALLLSIILWGVSFFVLKLVFTVLMNERKSEFALLRVMGAPRGYLGGLVLSEAFLVSLFGAALGTASGAFLCIVFDRVLSVSLDMPFLNPSPMQFFLLALGSLLLALLTGPAAGWGFARRLSREETLTLLRANR